MVAATPSLASLLEGKDRDDLLVLIYRGSIQRGFVLAQPAWHAIDADATLEELRMLALLASTPYDEADFCFWRNHILASPDLWPTLVREAES